MTIDDDFLGDTPHLIECIRALLELDASGALVPHGVGGHARRLLSAAAIRLSAAPACPQVAQPSDYPSVEAVENVLSMGCGGWDCVNPAEIIKAAVDLSRARPQADEVTPTIDFATVRVSSDSHGHEALAIECRFKDGQKYAPIMVFGDHADLAHRIADMLNAPPSDAADARRWQFCMKYGFPHRGPHGAIFVWFDPSGGTVYGDTMTECVDHAMSDVADRIVNP